MKRLLIAIATLLTLMVGFAQLQNGYPTLLQRLMGDRHGYESMMKAHKNADAEYVSSRTINGVEMIDAFIDIEDKSAINSLRKHGVLINCEFDDFVTAQVPVASLDWLTNIPGVKNVEISKVLELCTDSTLSKTHAGQVLNGTDFGLPQAYDGSGVVIGIIDNGFDYQHIAFRDADDPSRSRIVRVYDPLNENGHEVVVDNNVLPGSVFMGEQIDTLTTDNRASAHGTHTTSIAAGTHANGYGGMAPGADIVLCSSRLLNLNVSETEVVNCIKYIYSYADSVGKPCVISVSVSTASGSHDGNDRISKAVASTVGPGRIFVIAAGNNATKKAFCSGWATKNKPLSMLIGCTGQHPNWGDSYYYTKFSIDAWVKETRVKPVIQFHILDKTAKRIVWESPVIKTFQKINASEISEYYQADSTVDNQGYMYALISQSSSEKYNLQCHFFNLKSRSYSYYDTDKIWSRYQIGVSIYAPALVNPSQKDSCYIYSWLSNSGTNWDQFNSPIYFDNISETGDTVTTSIDGLEFYARPNDDSSIGTYAVHDSVISAGGYVARKTYYSWNSGRFISKPVTIGARYDLSSYQALGFGPTGRHLPTVSAPSYDVVAAVSRYSDYMTVYNNVLVLRTAGGDGYGIMAGTSMAAPTVAGIIAQWLQINPNLSPSDVKNVIAQTAIKDGFTRNPTDGYKFGPNGKIDAMAGAKYILSQMAEEILLGDINGDGKLSIKDVSTLISYLLNNETEIVFANADINGDGIISIKDVTPLISMLLQD